MTPLAFEPLVDCFQGELLRSAASERLVRIAVAQRPALRARLAELLVSLATRLDTSAVATHERLAS
jgi:hypothetical protein